MWGRKYLALAAIGFGLLCALLDVRGDAVFLFEAVVVILLMTIGLVGEARYQDRSRRHLR